MVATEYADKEIIKKSIELLASGSDSYLLLCTVVKTWGSSARPAGSLMIISQHNHIYGSVSGGCIEDDLQLKHKHGFFDDSYIKTLHYSANEENIKINIPCGASLVICVEKITYREQFIRILDLLNAGNRVCRILDIQNQTSSLDIADKNTEDFFYDDITLIKTFGPAWKILVIGANQIASYILPLAQMLEFKLTICEPREDYRLAWQNQDCNLTRLMPDDAVRKFANDTFSIVLSLSHDPKLDDMALMTALELDLFYVGAIGSKKSNTARIKRLQYLDLNDNDINKLHAPIGLDISSRTPAEIAISIFAELISLKNRPKNNGR